MIKIFYNSYIHQIIILDLDLDIQIMVDMDKDMDQDMAQGDTLIMEVMDQEAMVVMEAVMEVMGDCMVEECTE